MRNLLIFHLLKQHYQREKPLFTSPWNMLNLFPSFVLQELTSVAWMRLHWSIWKKTKMKTNVFLAIGLKSLTMVIIMMRSKKIPLSFIVLGYYLDTMHLLSRPSTLWWNIYPAIFRTWTKNSLKRRCVTSSQALISMCKCDENFSNFV